MKILDTTFLIDLLRGVKGTNKILDSKEPLFTTQINMYEVIRGLFLKNLSSSKFAEICEMFGSLRLLELDDNSIIKAAEISSELINKGMIISDCDCLIVGIALSKGVRKIVTRNVRHFNRIKGLEVEVY